MKAEEAIFRAEELLHMGGTVPTRLRAAQAAFTAPGSVNESEQPPVFRSPCALALCEAEEKAGAGTKAGEER